MGKKVTDMVGKKFSRLTVIEETNKRDVSGNIFYLCRCDCGNEHVATGYNLRSGNVRSCGCLNRDIITKFGNAVYKEKLYSVWMSMKSRCACPTDKAYQNYGARGIAVCERWKNDYGEFKKWAYSSGYKPKLWIDRINVDGNYCPENCKWATPKEQQRNKRNNTILNIGGTEKCVAEWAEIAGMSRATFERRLELGWRGKAMFAPVDKSRSHGERIRAALLRKNYPRTEITIREAAP